MSEVYLLRGANTLRHGVLWSSSCGVRVGVLVVPLLVVGVVGDVFGYVSCGVGARVWVVQRLLVDVLCCVCRGVGAAVWVVQLVLVVVVGNFNRSVRAWVDGTAPFSWMRSGVIVVAFEWKCMSCRSCVCVVWWLRRGVRGWYNSFAWMWSGLGVGVGELASASSSSSSLVSSSSSGLPVEVVSSALWCCTWSSMVVCVRRGGVVIVAVPCFCVAVMRCAVLRLRLVVVPSGGGPGFPRSAWRREGAWGGG